MSISLRTFRRYYLGLLVLLYLASAGLALGLRPFVGHRNSTWVIALISLTLVLGMIYSLVRKALSHGAQAVGYEMTCSIIVLFFEAVNVLVVLSLAAVDLELMDIDRALSALQLISLIKAGCWVVYFIPLTFCSVVVAFKYDRHVWFRDIDDTPSPFPPSVILGFLCPCLAASQAGTPSSVFHWDPLRPHTLGHICVPNCDCAAKPSTHNTTDISRPPANNLLIVSKSPSLSTACEPKLDEDAPLPIHKVASSSSLSRSLVHIPSDVQRRDSTVISFTEA